MVIGGASVELFEQKSFSWHTTPNLSRIRRDLGLYKRLSLLALVARFFCSVTAKTIFFPGDTTYEILVDLCNVGPTYIHVSRRYILISRLILLSCVGWHFK